MPLVHGLDLAIEFFLRRSGQLRILRQEPGEIPSEPVPIPCVSGRGFSPANFLTRARGRAVCRPGFAADRSSSSNSCEKQFGRSNGETPLPACAQPQRKYLPRTQVDRRARPCREAVLSEHVGTFEKNPDGCANPVSSYYRARDPARRGPGQPALLGISAAGSRYAHARKTPQLRSAGKTASL
jgi:hypothetical protein